MSEQWIDKVKADLASWRTRMDEMRVKGNLAGKELRDQLDEFRRAYWRAKGRLEVIGETNVERLSAATKALEEGWDKLREAYVEERQRLRDARDPDKS